MMRIAALALCLSLAAAAGAPSAFAQEVHFTATLNGASQVPPKAVPGTGDATVTLDRNTKTLTWVVDYRGLTGPAQAAHFHGPAGPDANAGIVVPMPVSPSPMKGSAQLTDPQIAEVMSGRWYINIHTAANPAGEIRGQVVAAR
jgi:hypothetical protein